MGHSVYIKELLNLILKSLLGIAVSRAHTETFVLTLKRAVSVLDLKSVVVSVARDGMKSVAVSAGR
jgi:hypothetical protein